MRGEHPKNMKKLWSVLIFRREAPKSARLRAFARFAQWLIRPYPLIDFILAMGLFAGITLM